MKLVSIITALFLLVSTNSFAANKCSTTKLIKVIQAQKKIEQLGFSWRDTYKKLIGPAKKAMKAGKCAKAEKLISTAMDHINLANDQYRRSFKAELITK